MGNSIRHTPIFGITTAETDKAFKVAEHRRERRAVKIALAETEEFPDPKEFGNPWKSEKDGKRYWLHAEPQHLRK